MSRWSRTTDFHQILSTIHSQLNKIPVRQLDPISGKLLADTLAYVKHEKDAALMRTLAEYDRLGKIPRFRKKGSENV